MSEVMVTVEDAAFRLAELVEAVSVKRESAVLMKAGRPIARIVPIPLSAKAVNMPTTPRLHGSKIDPKTAGFRSPEEEELQRKQSELEDLRSQLAESELELATLRSELVAFERR